MNFNFLYPVSITLGAGRLAAPPPSPRELQDAEQDVTAMAEELEKQIQQRHARKMPGPNRPKETPVTH